MSMTRRPHEDNRKQNAHANDFNIQIASSHIMSWHATRVLSTRIVGLLSSQEASPISVGSIASSTGL